MRTTIDIEDDLLENLREAARKARVPLKKMINSALRRALETPQKQMKVKPYKCTGYSMGEPVVTAIDLDKALLLAETLEDGEIARKMELRK